MSGPYEELINATIQHLQDLQAGGVRFIPVQPETLAALQQSIARPEVAPGPTQRQEPPAAPIQRVAPRIEKVPLRPSILPANDPLPPAPLVSRATRLDPQAKEEALRDLRERATACVKCPDLASSRQNVVFGVGDIHARLMFVGEAPGADEDAQGEPFVGAAGQLLTRIIQTMGLSRETVYIANILKCRPDTPGQTSGNRKPTPDEMKTCISYLHEQIDLIQPELLVGLGATAIEGLLGKTEGITRLRGRWQTYRGIPLMPTFHPSYLLHNQALSEKRKVWEDMLQVMGRLSMPISDKQRGFFLKA